MNEAKDADRISNELAHLQQVDLEPLEARQHLIRAQKRLAGTGRLRSNVEPAILVALATAQLLWAVLRVLELSAAHLG